MDGFTPTPQDEAAARMAASEEPLDVADFAFISEADVYMEDEPPRSGGELVA